MSYLIAGEGDAFEACCKVIHLLQEIVKIITNAYFI